MGLPIYRIVGSFGTGTTTGIGSLMARRTRQSSNNNFPTVPRTPRTMKAVMATRGMISTMTQTRAYPRWMSIAPRANSIKDG
jgi:hypothetical protein